jgi:hypothetical protein
LVSPTSSNFKRFPDLSSVVNLRLQNSPLFVVMSEQTDSVMKPWSDEELRAKVGQAGSSSYVAFLVILSFF